MNMKKENSTKEKWKMIFFTSEGMPIILSIIVITILFILFRMKGIEMNYKISSLSRDIEKVKIEGKELKAKKAKLLSAKNLRRMARNYNLSQPQQHQIIIIPE